MATRTTVTEQKVMSHSKACTGEKRLFSWHEAQPFEQDNPFILGGYRPLTNSYSGCWATILDTHNQTVNIWSHFLGAVLYAVGGAYLWYSLAPEYSTFATGDGIAFGCYFASVVVCLSLSVGFHLFSNHSHEVHDRHLFLDLLGILGLILGSWIPGIYYGFYCNAKDARFYWSMVSAVL